MSKKTLTKWMLGWMLAAVTLSGSYAFAQPDLNDLPKGENPPTQANWQKMWQNMTPEQRKQAIQMVAEQIVRGSLEQMEVNDAETQDLVIAAMREQDALYDSVREAHLKVAQALLNNKNTGEEQVAKLLQDLREASEKARAARAMSIKNLDDRIAFSQQPRLEALLTMLGLVGDETEHIGGVMASLSIAMGNLAVAGQLPPVMMPPGMLPPGMLPPGMVPPGMAPPG